MPSALLVGFLLSFFLLWVMMEGRKRYFFWIATDSRAGWLFVGRKISNRGGFLDLWGHMQGGQFTELNIYVCFLPV